MEKTPSLDQTVESTVAFGQKTFLNLQHTLEIHWFDACDPQNSTFKHQGGLRWIHHQVVGRINSGIFEAWPNFWTYRGGPIMKLEAVITTWKKYRKVSKFHIFFGTQAYCDENHVS